MPYSKGGAPVRMPPGAATQRRDWVTTVGILVVAAFLVTRALDFANQLIGVLAFLIMVLAPQLPLRIPWPRWLTELVRKINRFWIQLVAVGLFTSLSIVLVLLPIPFPTYNSRWWLWIGTAVLCFVMALIAAFVPNRRHDTLIKVSGLFVLLLVVGISAHRWWPPPDIDDCGAAQIAADSRLRSQVANALMTYQNTGGTGSRSCATALSVVEADDLHSQLLKGRTPLAGVVVADPPALRGLSGAWKNLDVAPVAPAQWHTLGLDWASVFLPSREHSSPEAVELSTLAGLRVGWAPFDPVALAVRTAPTSRWTPAFPMVVGDVSGRECPGYLVLPARSIRTCSAPKDLRPAQIVDQDGNPIGAPVLGIGLAFASSDHQASPTDPARKAAKDFLAWLDNKPDQLGLHPLTEPITAVLAGLPKQNDLIQQEAKPRPVHVTVILDASLSMGRASDPQTYGVPAPWRPTIDGLKRWWNAASRRAVPDRLSIVVAHTGAGGLAARVQHPVTGPLAAGWPPGTTPGTVGVPRGETGLVEALDRARAIAGDNPEPGVRRLTVLLTDGINAFEEQPVRASALTGVQVVVVGPNKGCTATIRALVTTRCRTAEVAGSDVAAELTALVSKTRAGPAR